MSLLGRTRFVVALASIAFTGCSQPERGAAVVPGAEAGRVVEVSGAVTATRSGQARRLAVGDAVSGDDVVSTGADGRIVIELRHNQVRWSLGPGREKKVADSAAWTAAKGTGGAAVTDERSGAAGRHAEREAADTAATAPAAQAAPAPAAQPAPAAAAAPTFDEAARDLEIEPARPKVQGKGVRARKAEAATPAEGPAEMRLLAASTVELTDEQIAAIVDPRLPAARACGRGKSGQIGLTFAIGADGKVSGITMQAPPELVTVTGCVRRAVKGLQFPAGPADRTARYTLTLTP
jgi:hypothetical protein